MKSTPVPTTVRNGSPPRTWRLGWKPSAGLPTWRARRRCLEGYVRFQAKRAADLILDVWTTRPEKDSASYVRWQYGLGRAAVFTSDAKSRVGPRNGSRGRATTASGKRGAGPAAARAGGAESRLEWGSGGLAPDSWSTNWQIPRRRRTCAAPVRAGAGRIRVRARHFRKSARASTRRGFPSAPRVACFAYVRSEESAACSGTRVVTCPSRNSLSGQNEKSCATSRPWTGGLFNPTPAQIFRPPARAAARAGSRSGPALLGCALLFNLAEVFWRRFRRPGAGRGACHLSVPSGLGADLPRPPPSGPPCAPEATAFAVSSPQICLTRGPYAQASGALCGASAPFFDNCGNMSRIFTG